MAKKIVIIGAGISGLALAWELQGKADVIVVEKAPRVGGWIRTDQLDGFLFERGPRSCRSNGHGQATLKLAEELGLKPVVADRSAAKRYLLHQGKLVELPKSPLGILTNPLMKGMRFALLKELFAAPGKGDDESVYDFCKRRMGQVAAERFIDPIVSGIYAGDPTKLSMRSCFPDWWNAERKHGSVIKGLRKRERPFLFSFAEGMEALPRALEKQLDVEMRLGTEVTALKHTDEGMRVEIGDEVIEADEVYSTLSQGALQKLVMLPMPLDFASVAVISMGWNQKVLPKQGFGYLIPATENQKILGAVWDSSVFPDQNRGKQTRITVMIGGTRMKDFEEKTKKQLEMIAVSGLERHLGITAYPDSMHPFIAKHAIPQYPVGHLQNRQLFCSALQQKYPALKVLGTSFHGVAVNDCIATARQFGRSD